jgi:hypothetical protein
MTRWVLALGGAALCLAGCGDKAQVLDHSKKAGEASWKGAKNAYVEPGWKAGDQKSWEQQVHNRAQAQNEYTRTGGAK